MFVMMTGGVAQILLVVTTRTTRMWTTILVKGVTTLAPKTPSNTNLACGLLFPVVAEAHPLLCQIGVVLGYLLPYPPDPELHRLAVKVKWYVCLEFIELINLSILRSV